MRKTTKRFVLESFHSGKDRRHVRDSLFGKVSDVEIGKALNYFDKLHHRRNNPQKFRISYLPKIVVYSVRIFFLYLVYLFMKLVVSFRKLFFGYEGELEFSDIEIGFSFAKYFRKIENSYSATSKEKKRKIFLTSLLVIVLLTVLIWANFFYYKSCSNESCFKGMVSSCHRSKYVSQEMFSLENKIIGMTFRGCKVEVTALANDLGVKENSKMICYLPKNSDFLPQSRIELCSGELREEIQRNIISELYKIVAQNMNEINSFLKRG